MTDCILGALEALRKRKCLFHSESHFSAWLGVTISETLGLEDKPAFQKAGFYTDRQWKVDLLFQSGELTHGVELKYARGPMNRGIPFQFDDDIYHDPLSGAADDITRFGFLKDVMRLESAVLQRVDRVGYALILTNISRLWSEADSSRSDAAFHINNGIPRGVLKWRKAASAKTTSRAGTSIAIRGRHDASWQEYSHIPDVVEGSKFMYLLAKISDEE